MIRGLTMPAWGMEDGAGTVVHWIVKEGDDIKLGQEIVEIETTKLTNVVESPFEGKLTKLVLQKGDSAPSGSLLAVVVDGEASPQDIEAFIAQHKQAAVAPAEAAPEERFIETSVGKVRVMSQSGGAATPVLLLHGFGADWTSWSFLFRALARSRVVHMIDLPGHGASFKDLGASPLDNVVVAVIEAARALGTPLHLAGHSLGGLVAVEAARKAGDLFKSVSLLAPAGLGGSINGDFLQTFADADSRKTARSAIEMLVSDKDSVSLAMVNDVIRARRVEGAKEALHALRGVLSAGDDKQAVDMRGAIGTLGVPVQLIEAANDKIIAGGWAPSGSAKVTTVSGAGHLLHMEKPSEVEKLLESFMEQNGG